MSKRVFRYFWLFMTSQEQWLNKMAADGYRLAGTTTAHYEFEECPTYEQRYNSYKKLQLWGILGVFAAAALGLLTKSPVGCHVVIEAYWLIFSAEFF